MIDNSSLADSCAMLMHSSLLEEYQLPSRAIDIIDATEDNGFLQKFIEMGLLVVTSTVWKDTLSSFESPFNFSDLIDGRLFLKIVTILRKNDMKGNFVPSAVKKFSTLASMVKTLCGMDLQLPSAANNLDNGQQSKMAKSANGPSISTTVLPFNNPIFRDHLKLVCLEVDKSPSPEISDKTSTIFKELSHWHNHRWPVDQKANTVLTPQEISNIRRRNQFFMAEMRDYAASLTNAVGGILEPETVFIAPSKDKGKEAKSAPKWTKDKGKPGKQAPAKSGKPSVRDMATSARQEKQNEALDKQIQKWSYKRDSFDQEKVNATRFTKVQQYLATVPSDKRCMVEAEILTYVLGTLVEVLTCQSENIEENKAMSIIAFMWDIICRISKLRDGITADIEAGVSNTIKTFGLPSISLEIQSQRKLSFKFPFIKRSDISLEGKLTPMEFQLIYAGPFMDRNMDSATDPRVHDFEPDKWQRDVLDQIDAKNSLFVVAPTSAGKTFISFYAMKQILQEDNDGVLVYVAPTKALVNQIAAEIQARFSKAFPSKLSGKSVWGIHTRDYRINNPVGCQVLVTVPHILQLILLAPTNAKSWSSRIKRIIFDEIHCIDQAEDGVVWEQLLLLSPCPIIALSATVGNPQEFCDWLRLTQKANGLELNMIEHRYRYSDLRKYIYQPPQKFSFNGLPSPEPLNQLGLDDVPGITFMHPVSSLTAKYPVDPSLNPSNCLPEVIRKADIAKWEASLKSLLKVWLDDRNSPFDKVLKQLSTETVSATRPEVLVSSGVGEQATFCSINANDILDTTLPLICSLHNRGALPALFFNYDRSECERICRKLLEQFQEGEARWKASSRAWKAKIAKWEEWKREQEKGSKKKNAKGTGKGAAADDMMSAADRMREEASVEWSSFESFDPESPVDSFHVADMKKLSPSEFNEYAYQLRRRSQPEWLIDALKRGIGVHHAGMNRKYRQVCEILFRKGYLRVVIATGTLALGINMPCKTVVFSGDSIYLTALNFRQAAGRSGRRGFDVLGNVVFQDVPYTKVFRLLSSRLPDLNGHFPITTSLVLRLFILLNESKQAPHAVRSINSILSCPRIYLGGPEMKDTVLHHLRFSIEYLRRNNLLDSSGAPLNFAGCISHLYFTESSSFAFHALLNAGYFHELSNGIEDNPKKTLLTLMLVMSHLFGRQAPRPSILESYQNAAKKSSSVVALPDLPANAAETLRSHNRQTLGIYAAYVTTFIDQHIKEPDCTLPLTGIKCGGEKTAEEVGLALSNRVPPRVTSAFFGLSGHYDQWSNISDLCSMVRSGVWLEESVVPYVNFGGGEAGSRPLNAYLYDFFKHGNVHELQKANGIRKGDIWFLLNDFSLIHATIITSMENFLKLSNADADMIDVMGSGSAHEANIDDSILEDEAENKEKSTKPSPSLPVRQKQNAPATNIAKIQKKRVVDSWEDDESDDAVGQGSDSIPESFENGLQSDSETRGQTQVPRDKEPKDLGSILIALKAFKMLRDEFDMKFKAMWA
ncbi:DEAD DEAH box helicase [Aspergillus sclerotialis]|uniref:DEAD DEAH box helicase n=1 Tax=Aspergillus sclerotialis TaxID=2070753 RepID=A0A3A2ZMY0_9EURO|nr:DEAD DEAH box helicase [Aspergillus sclerotialis]